MTTIDGISETRREYGGPVSEGLNMTGLRVLWSEGEFLTIEQTIEQTTLLWSTEVSIKSLVELINMRDVGKNATEVTYETNDNPGDFWTEHETTWEGLRGTVDDEALPIMSAYVELPDEYYWWGKRTSDEIYSETGFVFKDRNTLAVASDLIEATGTKDVKARGRQALESAMLAFDTK